MARIARKQNKGGGAAKRLIAQRVIDLRERFGDRYRIAWEANGATRNATPRDEWFWLLELHCRHGMVYPYGGDLLAACTDRPRIGTKLRRLSFVLSKRGKEETVVTFHVRDAEAVFRILKPYRRRRLSPAQRARNLENLARGRRKKREKLSAQSELVAVGSAIVTQDGAGPALAPLRASEGLEVGVRQVSRPKREPT